MRKAEKTGDAAMGIRTPVFGVKGRNDWPDYTIAATALFYEAYSYLSLLITALAAPNTGSGWDFPLVLLF